MCGCFFRRTNIFTFGLLGEKIIFDNITFVFSNIIARYIYTRSRYIYIIDELRKQEIDLFVLTVPVLNNKRITARTGLDSPYRLKYMTTFLIGIKRQKSKTKKNLLHCKT